MRYNIFGIVLYIRLKLFRSRTTLSVTVTEGLSAEVFVKAEILVAGNPSVLTANKICEL